MFATLTRTFSRLFAAVLLGAATLSAQCSTSWQPGDGLPGVDGGILATMPWDPDGPGPLGELLVVAGSFTAVPGHVVSSVALYDPLTGAWSTLGTGFGVGDGPSYVGSASVSALATLSTGELVIGGDFRYVDGLQARSVASWDGSSWTALNTSVPTPRVTALAALPGGELIAGGDFSSLGGATSRNVARWDGTSWNAMGTNEFQYRDIFDLHTMPNGDVLAGSESGVYRWDGTAWTTLGAALNLGGFGAEIYDLVELANGDILAAGQFEVMEGQLIKNIARFDGTSWTAFTADPLAHEVRCLLPMTNGDLMIGGSLTSYANAESTVGVWNGVTWQAVGSGLRDDFGGFESQVYGLTLLPTGLVLATGNFRDARIGATGMATWDTAAWAPIAPGTAGNFVSAEPDANGNLVVAGQFWAIGGIGARSVASWDGTTWTALNASLERYEYVDSMIRLSNGDLIVGGNFDALGGVAASGVARWDGTSWSPVGTGIQGKVSAMLPLEDGQFAVIGGFLSAGGAPARNAALWDGTDWKPLGNELFGFSLDAIAQLPTGELVVGGNISSVGGQPADDMAIWNGLQWAPFGVGTNGDVKGLKTLANGDLIASGWFTTIDGVPAIGVARYDGTTWSAMGAGLGFTALDVAELPGGDLVFAGYRPFGSGGTPFYAEGLARWDGTAWNELEGGIAASDGFYDVVSGLAFWQGELLALGRFRAVGPVGAAVFSSGIARLATTCPAAVTSYGSSCVGSGGTTTLSAAGLPWVGGSFDYRADGVPANSLAVEVRGFQTIAQPLASLLPQGLPGCDLLVSVDATVLHLPQAGSVQGSLALPNTQSLAGLVLHQQVVPIAFAAAGGGIGEVTSSNALTLMIGAF